MSSLRNGMDKTVGFGLRVVGCELSIVGCGLWDDCELTGHHFEMTDVGYHSCTMPR